MGFFKKLFSSNPTESNENFIRFQNETSRVIDISIQLLRNNSDGGFIKLFFDGKDSELLTALSDCPYHRDIVHFSNDWKKYFIARFPFAANNRESISTYVDSMNIIVNDPNSFESDIIFAYYYSFSLNNELCKNWFIKYIQEKYPEYKVSIEKDNVSFVVPINY